MSSHEDLRVIALAEFARAGYAGTSLQTIAEIAGLSKSSVLYHFSSKEALLEATIGPAIDRAASILGSIEGALQSTEDRREFIVAFSDFLLAHRLEVHLFINQGSSLVDVPVIERANAVIGHLAEYFSTTTNSLEDNMRFGIALGGAAYMLATRDIFADKSIDETRDALINILTELLSPVPVRSTTP